MRLPFEFDYYLEKRIAKKISPDYSRANFLYEESKNSFKGLKLRINKLGIDEFSANSIIKDIHDIIIQTIRSKMLLDGMSASGNYAHEAEVSYLRKFKFSDFEISFINTLRMSRNGINYYGRMFKKDYAEECYNFLKIKSKKLGL